MEALDEESMRANPSKQRKFKRLKESPYFAAVVEANRAYLQVAVSNPAETEREHWALSCLPGTTEGRLSAVSIKSMETFVLHEPADPEDAGLAEGFVVVRRSALERYAESGDVLDERFPGLDFDRTDYRDAGPDQLRVWGWHDELIEAFKDEYFAAAVRDLTEPLLRSKTMHWRGHNYQLADHVLGRV